jgi:predicted SnoaL-like aldol condensation-catalyzing enzyme
MSSEVESINQDKLEPEPINILEFSAEIYPDLRRVKVNFLLSSFLKNPNASVKIINQVDEIITSVDIVNIFSEVNEITLHLPSNQNLPGVYVVHLDLFNIQEEPVDGKDDQVNIITVPIKSETSTFSIQ